MPKLKQPISIVLEKLNKFFNKFGHVQHNGNNYVIAPF